jgi:pyruvate/2-oxoglutarate dehydrogenase complex dihydrolipoamide dehydrogenase (E3) component
VIFATLRWRLLDRSCFYLKVWPPHNFVALLHGRSVRPWCPYCDPEIADTGCTGDARRQLILVKSFTVMMQDVDRAITDGRDDGFVEIHTREGADEIIGATIVASRAR